MADINKLIPFLLKWEGGYSNHKADRGGATMKGITIATYRAYCKAKGLPEPTIKRLKGVSMEEWKDILRTLYWDKFRADDINSQSVANICVDWAWMSGKTAIKNVQRILGVKADGVVGPITLAAINSRSPLPLFGMIKERRKEFYAELVESTPSQQVFFNGWMNRLSDLNFDD